MYTPAERLRTAQAGSRVEKGREEQSSLPDSTPQIQSGKRVCSPVPCLWEVGTRAQGLIGAGVMDRPCAGSVQGKNTFHLEQMTDLQTGEIKAESNGKSQEQRRAVQEERQRC